MNNPGSVYKAFISAPKMAWFSPSVQWLRAQRMNAIAMITHFLKKMISHIRHPLKTKQGWLCLSVSAGLYNLGRSTAL